MPSRNKNQKQIASKWDGVYNKLEREKFLLGLDDIMFSLLHLSWGNHTRFTDFYQQITTNPFTETILPSRCRIYFCLPTVSPRIVTTLLTINCMSILSRRHKDRLVHWSLGLYCLPRAVVLLEHSLPLTLFSLFNCNLFLDIDVCFSLCY